MTLHRRTWLKLVAHSPWLALLLGTGAGAQQDEEALPARDLKLLVDTLVPADESPGAVALGIHRAIETDIRQRAGYRELLTGGMDWFNRESQARFQARFSDLPEEARILLLTVAEKSPRNSAQHRLFSVLRRDVMQRYYTHPDAWAQLHYQGPPQPDGLPHDQRSSGLPNQRLACG